MQKTAEAVSPKHPDKMCDQISDAILDFCLEQDSMARVAIETMGGHGKVTVMGEVSFNGILTEKDIAQIVERITGERLFIDVNIAMQSSEIAQGVDTGGAGDQGIMIGYACDENEAMIPQELYLARHLNQTIYSKHPFDGKTQITLDDAGKIKTIVASFQNVTKRQLMESVNGWLESIGQLERGIKTLCNPAGDWIKGGFDADTGLTGRKLMVDNYGPQVPIGGGCFSGKDATKVDRSAAYMARKIAVDFLKILQARGEKEIKITVKLAYAIGLVDPVMAIVDIDSGKGYEQHDLIHGEAEKLYNLTPKGIIHELRLQRPQFEKTAMWGHFGNEFTWDN